jgi:hypothetical protein
VLESECALSDQVKEGWMNSLRAFSTGSLKSSVLLGPWVSMMRKKEGDDALLKREVEGKTRQEKIGDWGFQFVLLFVFSTYRQNKRCGTAQRNAQSSPVQPSPAQEISPTGRYVFLRKRSPMWSTEGLT